MRCLPLQVYTLALYCASWIVPEEERREWLREWKAELWHIASLHTNRKSVAFVAGAFQDAYVLNADLRQAGVGPTYMSGCSPILCMLLLLLTASTSVGIAFLLPGTRSALLPSPYGDARSLVVVSRDGSSRNPSPSVSLGEFRYWQQATRGVFSDLAYYQVVRKQLHTGPWRRIGDFSRSRL